MIFKLLFKCQLKNYYGEKVCGWMVKFMLVPTCLISKWSTFSQFACLWFIILRTFIFWQSFAWNLFKEQPHSIIQDCNTQHKKKWWYKKKNKGNSWNAIKILDRKNRKESGTNDWYKREFLVSLKCICAVDKTKKKNSCIYSRTHHCQWSILQHF